MPSTMLIGIPRQFTDTTMKKLERDPIIQPGSIFLYDFTNPITNPYADAYAFQLNDKFYNLVDGNPDAIVAAGNTYFSNLAGKTGLSFTSSNSKDIQFGGNGDFNYNTDEKLVIFWIKLLSDFTTTAYYRIFGLGPNTAAGINDQFRFDSGIDGKTIRAQQGNGTTVSNSQLALNIGSVYQIALHIKPGAMPRTYINGITLADGVAGPSPLLSITTLPISFGSLFKGNLYRAYGERVNVSNAADPSITAASQVQLDYLTNVSRFT